MVVCPSQVLLQILTKMQGFGTYANCPDTTTGGLSEGFAFDKPPPVRSGQYSKRPSPSRNAPGLNSHPAQRPGELVRSSVNAARVAECRSYGPNSSSSEFSVVLATPTTALCSSNAPDRELVTEHAASDTQRSSELPKTWGPFKDLTITSLGAYTPHSRDVTATLAVRNKSQRQSRRTTETARGSGSRSRRYTTSVCGDLEPTGVLQRRQASRRRETSRTRTSSSVTSRGEYSPHGQRSQSRASNVSKKRHSAPRKGRYIDTTTKRYNAMAEVAQRWNQCIDMATQEQMLAQDEIEELRAAVLAEQEKLSVAKVDVNKAGQEKAEMTRKCQELEKEQVDAKQINKMLQHDLDTLRAELEDSNTVTVQLREKYTSCMDKLQVTNEQQTRTNKQLATQFDRLIQDIADMRKEGDGREIETDMTIWKNRERTDKLEQEMCDFRNERARENERSLYISTHARL